MSKHANEYWKRRHREAMRDPHSGFELAIVEMYDALGEYADAHRNTCDSPIGDDGVLGEEWKQIALGVIGLLNGETGRLDCGTLDRQIREMAAANGVELE